MSLLSRNRRGIDGNWSRFALKQRHSDHPSIALPRLSRESPRLTPFHGSTAPSFVSREPYGGDRHKA
jgi:hypothetical protein